MPRNSVTATSSRVDQLLHRRRPKCPCRKPARRRASPERSCRDWRRASPPLRRRAARAVHPPPASPEASRGRSHRRRRCAGPPAQRRRLCDLSRLACGEAGGRWAARAARRRRGGEARRQSRHDLFGAARRRTGFRHGRYEQATAVEKLVTRDVWRSDCAAWRCRARPRRNSSPPSAMAKSMVTWHQRHGFCANCGTPRRDGGWKRDCPSCKAEHFPPRSGRDHAASGEKCLLGRQKQFFCRGCGRAWPASSKRRRPWIPPRDFQGIRHPLHRRQLLHDAAMALSIIADDRMRRARAQRGYCG